MFKKALKSKFVKFIASFCLILTLATSAYSAWLAIQLQSFDQVLGTAELAGDLEGSINGIDYLDEFPILFNNDGLMPGDDVSTTFFVRPTEGMATPAKLGVKVRSLVITQGLNPQGAEEIEVLPAHLEITFFGQTSGVNEKDLIADFDGDGRISLFDLTTANQGVSFLTGEYTLSFNFNPLAPNDLHGDSCVFDFYFYGI